MTGGGKTVPQARMVGETRNRHLEGHGLAGRNEHSVHAVPDRFGNPTNGRGDDRATGGHGFQDGQALGLAE